MVRQHRQSLIEGTETMAYLARHMLIQDLPELIVGPKPLFGLWNTFEIPATTLVREKGVKTGPNVVEGDIATLEV